MPAIDTFSRQRRETDDPAAHAAAVTPHNTNDLTTATRGIYVGASGDVKVDMLGGETGITFVGLAAGIIHPIRATRIYSTGTTALMNS